MPLGDGTLVAPPELPSDDMLPSLLAASDVLGTGWFGAVAAGVGPGKTVAVVRDGAVGLLGVLDARELGAERIIAMSRHESRQALATEFGAKTSSPNAATRERPRIKELTESTASGPAASTPERSSTSSCPCPWSLRGTRPWTNAGPSRPCCAPEPELTPFSRAAAATSEEH